ncbi:MAG: hypothetical protein H7141_12385 [Burkholderiales bacterium]|nr:hypothetical protein [Bacteroidia bacterium]
MTEFRIVEDQTLSYKCNNQLFIMIVQIKGQYFIEINTRTKQLGRRAICDRKTSELVAWQLIQNLSRYNYIQPVIDVLRIGFKLKTLREFMFLIKITNQEIEFDEIYILKKRYGFDTHPITGSDSPFDFNEVSSLVTVIFPNRKFAIGNFKTISEDKDSKYKFELSEFYSYRD